MNPAKVQLRGFNDAEISIILRKALEFKAEVFKIKHGIDLVFEDVEDARKFISKLRKDFRFETRMSTENLGFKGGRGQFLFVYSLRKT